MAAAKETDEDGAVAAVLSELDGIFTSKDKKKHHRRLFSVENMLLLYLGKSLGKNHDVSQLPRGGVAHIVFPLEPTGTFKLLLTCKRSDLFIN